jgi:hypothetical protein
MRAAYYDGIAMRTMRHKIPKSGLAPELRAVMRASPGLEPCREFRKARIDRFAAHIREGKCEQCIAFVRQLGEGIGDGAVFGGEQELTPACRHGIWQLGKRGDC